MRLPLPEVLAYAARYPEREEDAKVMDRTNRIRKERELHLADLCAVCDWKSRRSARHARKNTEEEVVEISSFALRATSEKARIEALQLLRGVSYPTASAILHLYHAGPYPILDFRVIWTLGLEQPPSYDFKYWTRFVDMWRRALVACWRLHPALSARDFDRALWQYSKENQGRLTESGKGMLRKSSPPEPR